MSAPIPSAVNSNRAVVEKSTTIDASPEVIFESILEDMQGIPDAQGKPMDFKLEAFPGGRWYRDLGNNAGHFWGHVQVIKPPTLIEVFGPLMISSAAVSHVTYRVKSEGGKQTLTITHKIFGDFDPSMPGKVDGGWQMAIDRIQARALKRT
ncbi:MAG: hypothetical protein JWM57_2499 [Phycisphaerales bacterium]|nr:hypothetical protein [Phycisphaerales bacterium]